MTTPTLIRGWEHGLATLSSNGGGVGDGTVGSTVSVQSTTKRTGDYALEISKSAAANVYVTRTLATPTVVVGSVYVRYATFPATADDDILWCTVTSGATLSLKINITTKKVYARFWGVLDGNTADLALSLNTWYRIDFRFDVSANPSKIDFQVAQDGSSPVAATQSTYAQAATTLTYYREGSTNTNTSDVFYDDEVLSQTSADYPIGAHTVVGLRPGSDGTHNNATNIMEDSAGNDIDGSTYYAFDKLDESPWTTTANADYVRQTGNGTANYCEVQFADTSANTILGVMAYLEYASAATTANTGGCIIRDSNGQETTLWGAAGALADYSETSAFFKAAIVATPSGGWTQAHVNALRCRFGYSDDANPDPYWLALLLEVAVSPVYDVSLTEAASASDAASAVATYPDSATEAASAGDTPSAAATFAGSLTEAASASDMLDATAGGTYNDSVTEAATAADTPSAVLTTAASTTEAATAADTPSAVLATAASTTEAATAADTPSAIATYAGSLTEAASAGDTIDASVSGVFNDSVTEAATAADTPSAALATAASTTEAASAGDAVSATVIYAVSVTEAASAGDTISASVNGVFNDSVTEVATAADTPSAALTTAASMTEAASAGDAVSATVIYAVSVTEAASAGDAVSVTVLYAVSVTEAASATETCSLSAVYTGAIVETASAADACDWLAAAAAHTYALRGVKADRVRDNVPDQVRARKVDQLL